MIYLDPARTLRYLYLTLPNSSKTWEFDNLLFQPLIESLMYPIMVFD